VGEYSSLVLDSSSYPVISYYDHSNGDLKLAVCHDPACTNPDFTTVNFSDDEGWQTSVDLSSSGNPVVSYYDSSNGSLSLLVCYTPNCSASSVTAVDNSGYYTGGYSSLKLDNSDYPFISYFDIGAGDLKLAVCSNQNCSNPYLEIVDSVGDVGRYTSLALNSSSIPIISYWDAYDDDLKLAV
jgi:hypothetical protein